MYENAPGAPEPAATRMDLAVVVGLGNPGPGYAGNRHNAGAMVVHEMAAAARANLKRGSGKLARIHSTATRLGRCRVVLARPTTYMNESGQAVRPLLDYYHVDPGSLIVLHDELDLPFGIVRIKCGGGDNGHNGLRSVTAALGTPDYVRVRIGIGRPVGHRSPANHVLSDFVAEERARLPTLLRLASRAVTLLIEGGLGYAQNEVHGTPTGDYS